MLTPKLIIQKGKCRDPSFTSERDLSLLFYLTHQIALTYIQGFFIFMYNMHNNLHFFIHSCMQSFQLFMLKNLEVSISLNTTVSFYWNIVIKLQIELWPGFLVKPQALISHAQQSLYNIIYNPNSSP